MERSAQKNGLVNLVTLLLVGVAGFIAARHSHSLGGQVSVAFIGLGLLIAVVSWFQMRLEENERLERLELEGLARSRKETALFENKDAELFPARRSREQFERFFVPFFTVVLCLLVGAAVYLFWRWFHQPASMAELRQPTTALSLFATFSLLLFLLGRFSATYARLENQRLLRASASYLLLNAFLCALVAAGLLGVVLGFTKADLYVGYILIGLLVLVAVEMVINLVLEIYRPRVRGKVQRPLYESRLVGLLGQPEGLITTAAQALDYQFGFKVSETWFYRFFEKALGWIILLQVGALVLSTTVVFIDAGEQGLLERFGKPVEGRTVLGPGAHLKLPWPMEQVHRFRTEQIQSFTVGSVADPERATDRVVLWTVSHTKEENFLVANRDATRAEGTNNAAGKRTPPVSLLTVSIPVQFQITNLMAWVYENEDAPALLQSLATREVVRYLMGADMNELMSSGREAASRELVNRIQQAAANRKLGARIVSLGLQDLHPPVKVAPDYEKVVGAVHIKQAKILAAQGDAIKTNALADAVSQTTLDRAAAERTSREIGALAQAALFTNQIPAFQAAPSVYLERAYLQAFTRSTMNARKYVLLTTNKSDVLTFDLQEKVRWDLLNDVSAAPQR